MMTRADPAAAGDLEESRRATTDKDHADSLGRRRRPAPPAERMERSPAQVKRASSGISDLPPGRRKIRHVAAETARHVEIDRRPYSPPAPAGVAVRCTACNCPTAPCSCSVRKASTA